MTGIARFQKDHVLRDVEDRPIARAVLKEGYVFTAGAPFQVVLLMVSMRYTRNPLSVNYYVDGVPYRIPKSISPIRVSVSRGVHNINSFVMEPYHGK